MCINGLDYLTFTHKPRINSTTRWTVSLERDFTLAQSKDRFAFASKHPLHIISTIVQMGTAASVNSPPGNGGAGSNRNMQGASFDTAPARADEEQPSRVVEEEMETRPEPAPEPITEAAIAPTVNMNEEGPPSPAKKSNSRPPNKQPDGVYIGERNDRNEKHGHGVLKYTIGDVYEGQWKNNKKHGKGVYTYKNGDCYDGDFVKGKKEGQGTYTYASGDKFVGPFRNGKKNGFGLYKFANGSQYEGDFEDDIQHGQGTFVYPTGAVYNGGWHQGEVHGVGSYTYSTGDVFSGEYEAGKLHGKGVYKYNTGDIVEGQFQDGEPVGFQSSHSVLSLISSAASAQALRKQEKDKQSVIFEEPAEPTEMGEEVAITPNTAPNTYESKAFSASGKFGYEGERNAAGEKHGEGNCRYSNGDYYAGQWEHNKKHGQGFYRYANGDTYTGEFANGYKDGPGIYIYQSGEKYHGTYKNGKMNGSGEYTYFNGSVYNGQFVDNMKHGTGTYKYATGAVYEGSWVNNKQQGNALTILQTLFLSVSMNELASPAVVISRYIATSLTS